jgi:hypothetical protein
MATLESVLYMLRRIGEKPGTGFDHIAGTSHAMVNYWGPECPDFEPGCACCEAWRFWRTNGFVPDVDDLDLSGAED